jgi:hypothetical protein
MKGVTPKNIIQVLNGILFYLFISIIEGGNLPRLLEIWIELVDYTIHFLVWPLSHACKLG